ncbi:MAG: hypothetical protein HUU11_01370 [Anaerolineales bacterium]|nr:hypothetical protein [Anaerolineales bacterium]
MSIVTFNTMDEDGIIRHIPEMQISRAGCALWRKRGILIADSHYYFKEA